ncbi:MobQ family relaxase [Novosphingobium naphthalenivorans]|uniref:MobQ family relaxase n=1 Tax=Novosphingobium naphthalenivorans TaxID=273168 RepID=UPI002480ED5E|nr:MobQ family relaxase [Novosphingobium naphthalenivorans]
MRVQVLKRSAGRSAVAAAAYRAGERLHDERQDVTHDYSRRSGVEHSEILLPADAPQWIKGIDRETLWNRVEAGERRKDAQVAREIRVMIPREIPQAERIPLIRQYVIRNFVSRGMVADVAFHNGLASDGKEQPHVHIMLTMRPLSPEGFGKKSRHDWVPDPDGRTHPDGRPVMVESNPDSWNSARYYEETCRADWERTANAALTRAGSDQQIDRRSYLERGLARLPEPALRLAFHLKELRGVLKDRFGQFQFARHYRAVEERAKAAFRQVDIRSPSSVQAFERFHQWFDRQIERLQPAPRDPPGHERTYARNPTPDLER